MRSWDLNLTISLARVRYFRILFSLFTIGLIPIFAAAKDVRPMQLGGYKVVPVRYGPSNKMMLSVAINGHPANLLVDTGANQNILDASSAESFGVSPSRHGLRYVGFTQINGQLVPVGFVRSLTAGSMNFGSSPVALLSASARSSFSNRLEGGALRIDGVLGRPIFIRHKAVINFRTKLIFFKVDRARASRIASFALSEQFTKVPLRQEGNGAFTVPCSIHGQTGRLLVDTGAFVTTFHEPAVKSLGIALQPTPASARFTTGVVRQVSIGQFNDLTIGDFKVPATKFGVAVLPNFALQQSNTRINGILGMDVLFSCHGILDFDSMNLFLK
jgi:predicted aspartyl protease